MKSFFKFSEKNSKKPGKIIIVFLLVLMSFSFLVIQPKPVQAQLIVMDTLGASIAANNGIMNKIAVAFKYLWQKGGSMAFQQTLRTVLNKVAMDSANYVGSGGQGQKPLFITNPWSYVGNLGDEAAGAYLENFASNLSASSACDSKQKTCKSDCAANNQSDYDAWDVCLAQCNSVCDSASTVSARCKKTCTSNYENAYYQGMVGSESGGASFDPDTAVAGRTTCFSACDSAAKSTNSGLSNSIATPSFNVCQPSSIDAKLRITLGLAEQSRAQGPDCKATDIVKNWSNLDNYGNSVKALKDLYDTTQGGYNDQVFLNDIQGIFDPRGNDFGIYLTAKTDSAALAADSKLSGTTNLISKGGWLDSLDIAGNSKGLPNQAEINTQQSYKQYSDNFGKYTGDAFVDALNTFLNQTAFTAFNTLMQNLGKTATTGSNSSGSQDYSNPNSNPNLGEGAVKEATAKLNKPDFGSQTNYDILSLLAMCQNEKNPGPTDCVIDNKLMQAITEYKTVIEAINDGSLIGTWLLTKDNVDSAYTLRNISILRKYMILPVGWEEAIRRANDPTTKAIYHMTSDIGTVTLNDLVSCFDNKDNSYDKFSAKFDKSKQSWCEGLVDPNWVLKAPLNYCRKEGIGGQILTDSVLPGFKGINGQPDTLSTYNVTRAENYCADEQTCIKEKSNGNCDAYGYCTDEKRTWNFSSDSCQPINNTCRTFNGGASSKTVSYLENTLSYTDCNANSAGCRQYSYYGTYSKGVVSWDQSKSIYFNGSTAFSSCDQSVEGCTGLIRVKSGSGVNLVINSDFSADTVNAPSTGSSLNSWPIRGSGSSQKATIVDANSESWVSSRALKLEIRGTSIETYSDGSNSSILPKNLQIIPGQAYTLSAEVYLVSGDKAQVTIGSGYDLVSAETIIKNSWQTIKVTRSPQDSFNSPIFSVGASSANTANITVFIRNIKFEESNFSSSYSSYGATGSTKIYEKLLPKYLEASCYVAPGSDSRLKSNNTSELSALCNQFARKCNRDEVGCELYSSPFNTFNVAAKVSSSDLCPEECLNYDIYIARLDAFSPAQSEKIIPETAKKCSAEEVGCSEFTNLDSLSQGGENKEYYSELKQCIKPSTSDCAAYYAWEGTENGYQLKSYTLKKGLGGGPAVTLSSDEESKKCNTLIYHSSLSSPSYNSDCVEFYNVAGQITYHLVSKTITCSENCHSYRLTEKNIDSSILQPQCTGGDRNWDVQNNGCQVCLNGGVWSATHQACLYQAIPSEGKTCQASSKDCREYNGSNGEVVRLISASDFENTNNWFSNCSNGVSIETISNVNNGHSLLYNNSADPASCSAIGESGQSGGSSRVPLIKQILADSSPVAQLSVGQSVKQGFAYNISFLAKAVQATSLEIYFYNKETGARSLFKSEAVKGGNEWQIYKANLENLDHVVSNNEVLVITGSGNFYFDNFVLNEISERYYLIKGTSNVPLSCSFDNFGNNPENYMSEDYNLGCRAYTNRAGVKVNLRQFSKLCDESGVGCEQMIDTKNSNSGGAQNVCNGGNCVDVPADETIYAVYDAKKQCNSVDAGCSRLGQLTKTSTDSTSATKYFWTDVFKRNNPDNYSSTLCGASSVGCEKWTNEEGASYFKDPGDKTCVYRTASGLSGSGKKWYQSPEKRCDKNKDGKIDNSESGTSVCLKDSDCNIGNNGATCILDNTDHLCTDVSYNKTFGLGGVGNEIPVPNQVGLCDPKESSCTEYIDPVSSFVPNLVYNSSYQPAGVGVKDGWTATSSQTFELEAHKLYIFQVEPFVAGSSVSGSTNLNFTDQIQVLSSKNTLSTSTLSTIGNPLTIQGAGSILFYTPAFNSILNPNFGKINVTVTNPNSNKNIIVKPAIVDYQLKTNIDTETKSATCNNGLQPDQGCVGFNERTINGGFGLATLNTTYGSYTNRLIKVQPDRVCSKWLSCITYIQEPGLTTPTCYAVGECDRLSDDNKQCANFLSTPATRTFDINQGKNASGYSLIGNYYFGQMAEVGANSDFHYDFEDLVPYLSCAREGTSTPCSFTNNKNIAKELLVKEKVGAPTDYPAHGKSYLKVPAGFLISPQVEGTGVSLIPNSEYYLNFLINTRNSGIGGKIHIKYKIKDDKTAAFKDLFATSTVYTANAGWERKILKFKTATQQYVYRVELGTDPINQSGTVYFDDLNIEPVLNTGDNKYVARECRLYPETSSLTCNDSLARDGLEGYCLEHDLKNPAVCSLWYPVDHINSAQTGKAMNGYNGIAPLSYCNQVNGNFSIVEKRMVYLREQKGGGTDTYFPSGQYKSGDCKNTGEPATMDGFFYRENDPLCNKDYVAFIWSKTQDSHCNTDIWCVPKAKNLVVNHNGTLYTEHHWSSMSQNAPTAGYTESPILSLTPTVNKSDKSQESITANSEGWYLYNGLATPSIVSNSLSGQDQLWPDESKEGNSGTLTLLKDPIRVYDYNNPPKGEENLKLVSGPDPEKNFRLACDSFTQVVDSLGNNKAWSNRVSIASIYPTTTPAFFLNQNGDWYGGNLGLVEKRISHHVSSNFTSKYMAGCDGNNSKDGFNYKDVEKNSAYGTCESYGYPSADYVDFYYEYTTYNALGTRANGCQGEYWCVPKLSGAMSTSSYGGTYSEKQIPSSVGPILLVSASVTQEGITSTSDGWYLYNGLTVAEANNDSPAIKLYDYTVKPAISTEDGLQSISNVTEYALSRYGRNRQDAPFGAAVLPDSLDLLGSEGGSVKFRDQYSTKQNETIFAGRPYGCSGKGCMNIGACSLNPDVYCLVDPESLNSSINLNSETCNNGGYGVCVPLWYRRLSSAWINNADYQQILKTLFLKSYTSYSFNAFGYVANTNTYAYDSVIEACKGSRGPDNQLSSFCAIYPRVTYVKLKLNGQVNGSNNISPRGVYTLEFNTLIDPEQQPLKELQINWDAANSASSDIQTITGQDAKASTSTPHTFYHYYKQSGTKNVEIKATDNWGFFGTSSAQILDYSS